MSIITMNAFQRTYRKAIAWSKVGGIIWFLQAIHDMKPYERKHAQLRQLPEGTVGRAVADLLDRHNLLLIPRFESHDLKHLILGYDMTPEDEVKMQAFLFGNGNYSLPCLLFLASGLFMPEIWGELKAAYNRGKQFPSIYHLKLDECTEMDVNSLKKVLFEKDGLKHSAKTPEV